MRSSPRKSKPRKPGRPPAPVAPAIDDDHVRQLRRLAHDLSNALEAILQACYLLNHGKVGANALRWVKLIDTASQDAAQINRDMHAALRALSGE